MRKEVAYGFNRSFAGKNATVYGRGVYFARDASYSTSQTYSKPDSGGVQHMPAQSQSPALLADLSTTTGTQGVAIVQQQLDILK